MSKNGPIVIVEDDPDDQEMIERIIKSMQLQNELRKFFDGEELLAYLKETEENPFIIICDINMPIMNGIKLKQEIEKSPRLKKRSIPFIYLSTTGNPQQVREAYENNVQGFFVKGQSFDALRSSLRQIIEYWKMCIHSSNV